MSNIPKISIIVPVYKVEQYLRRCLDSIVAQTFTDWECILVDDGSPDGSGTICDEYAFHDSRFRVIHRQNAGVSAARNAGLDAAQGKWILFSDSDDWLCASCLSLLLDTSCQNDADVTVGAYFLNDGKKDFAVRCPSGGTMEMPKDFAFWWQGPWAKLIKKSVLHKHNIKFPEEITLAEDLYFTFFLFYHAKNICAVEDCVYHYFQNKNSVCNTISEKNLSDELLVISEIEGFIRTSGTFEKWESFLADRKIMAKNKFIFSLNKEDFISWFSCFPEIPAKTVIEKSPASRRPVIVAASKKHFLIASVFLRAWKFFRRVARG